MYKLFCQIALPVCCLLVGACGGADKPAPAKDNKAQNAVGTPSSKRKMALLEGIYATSESPAYPAHLLFEDKIWRTAPGTGPDEGLMLYFEEAQRIGEIKAYILDSTQREAPLHVYINGAPAGVAAFEEAFKVQEPNVPVKSLFLRIGSELGATTSRPIRSTSDMDIEGEVFPRNASFAFSRLELRDPQGDLIQPVAPARVPASISASSTLQPASAFSPARLFDGRKEFAWAEGNSANSGEGETIEVAFEKPTRISALRIWNGYQRSNEHFNANARVQKININGNTYTLNDASGSQRIALEPAFEGQKFSMAIESVYPGGKYADLVISEMLFYDDDTPFVPAANAPTPKAEGALVDLLNRRIGNTVNEFADLLTRQSLILRSDGTFVMYRSVYGGDGSDTETAEHTVAEGNWEQQASNKVRVFGKVYNSKDVIEWYKGSSRKEFTRIFSETLEITPSKISGPGYIGVFYR
ncbi:MAG: NADase-type glycan-binding domain-containing protein [Saprospiraceae bacterium]